MQDKAGDDQPLVTFRAKLGGGKWKGNVSVRLSDSGATLKAALADACGVPVERQQVLASGKKVKDDVSLAQQRIKASSMLLVREVKLVQEVHAQQQQEARDVAAAEGKEARLAMLKEAALDFARRRDGGSGRGEQQYLELTDQHGRPVSLPAEVRTALVAGKLLQNHGRQYLGNGDYEAAAITLQYADDLFGQVPGFLMEGLADYGYLCLDLVWSLFCIRNLARLSDASEKLKQGEAALTKAFGANMERLMALRDGMAPERALYVRLHLLRGVVAYHEGYHVTAQSYLKQAEDELRELRVSDADLEPLLGMGFDASEARRAMRACRRDAEAAAAYIMKRRDQLAERRRQERERHRMAMRQRRWGRTAAGDWVNVEVLDGLVAMGFEADLVGQALRQTNNDHERSVAILTESPELLRAASAEFDARRARGRGDGASMEAPAAPSSEAVAHLVSMGFTASMAAGTLKMTHGDVDQAVHLLLAGQGQEDADASANSLGDALATALGGSGGNADGADALGADALGVDALGADIDAAIAAAAAAAAGDGEAAEETPEERAEREEREAKDALRYELQCDLADEVEEDDEAFLDMPLDDEAAALAEYKSMLQSQGKWI